MIIRQIDLTYYPSASSCASAISPMLLNWKSYFGLASNPVENLELDIAGYAIVYDRNVVTLLTEPTFFEPRQFQQGVSQARPPVQTRFRINENNMEFFFYTWQQMTRCET